MDTPNQRETALVMCGKTGPESQLCWYNPKKHKQNPNKQTTKLEPWVEKIQASLAKSKIPEINCFQEGIRDEYIK